MDMASKRGNGEGSIRHNVERNRWEGRISVNGSRRMITARTRRELTDRMRTAQRAADHGAQSARADLTVARYLKRWMTDVLPGTVAAATEAQYCDVLRLYVLPRIGTKRLAALTPSDVDGMLRDMARPTDTRPDGYSPTARRLARSILRRALRRAEAEGLITRNAAALSNSVRQDRREGRSLTPPQARLLLAAARVTNTRPASSSPLAVDCGCRNSSGSPGMLSNSSLPVRESSCDAASSGSRRVALCCQTRRRTEAAASCTSHRPQSTLFTLNVRDSTATACGPARAGWTNQTVPISCSARHEGAQSSRRASGVP
jgi:hypothetical protein